MKTEELIPIVLRKPKKIKKPTLKDIFFPKNKKKMVTKKKAS